MEAKETRKDNREYTIKLIPHQGTEVKSIRLPIKWIKYGGCSLLAGILLLACSVGYSTYSSYSLRNEAAQIEKLQEANTIQQEQLLQLSKKANLLQEELNELGQVEQELRQMTGVEGGIVEPTVSSDENAHSGKGGPVGQTLKLENVQSALADIERRVAIRKSSLEQFKGVMVQRNLEFQYQNSLSLATPSIWPCSGDVSSSYGLRWGGSDFHPGIDIANDIGTPIYATADGVVTDAGWNSGGYGYLVDIEHGYGYATRYAHADSVVVAPGQEVKRGEIIAYMGNTGYSTGPHLHYEVFVDGHSVNPAGYL